MKQSFLRRKMIFLAIDMHEFIISANLEFLAIFEPETFDCDFLILGVLALRAFFSCLVRLVFRVLCEVFSYESLVQYHKFSTFSDFMQKQKMHPKNSSLTFFR